MSVFYDPIYDNEVGQTPLSEDVTPRESYGPTTQKYLKMYLKKIKNFQDIDFSIDDAEGKSQEQAFIKTLYIMKKWIDSGDEVTVNNMTASVKGIHEKFKNAKVLVWVETDNARVYYTLKFLDNNMNINKIEAALTGMNETYDGYDGLMPNYDENGNVKIPRKMGITFFKFNHDKFLRKVPDHGVPDEHPVKIRFPGSRISSEDINLEAVLSSHMLLQLILILLPIRYLQTLRQRTISITVLYTHVLNQNYFLKLKLNICAD